MVNLYDLLKVAPTASEEEIKKAINKELRIWSNRTNAPQIQRRQEAERMVKLLEEAENTLLNTNKRAEYDRQFKSAPRDERHIDEAEFTGRGDIDLVQEAWRLLIAGNVADALYVATRATQVQGSNPEAWAVLGQSKVRWGETEDAIYEYKRAIQLKPNEASYYFDLGSIYESVERWKDALQQYQRASQIDPRSAMYRAAIGILFIKNEMFKEGIDILERCVQEEPNNDTYQWFLALAYHEGMLASWWKNPENGMYYCISKEQADEAQKIIKKANALKFDDDDLRGYIAKTQQLVNSMYERTFKGSWIMVVLWGLLYVVPGVLWWYVNRRPQYKINKDIHDIIEMGKKDALVGGEAGAYYSALPPGLKWAATSLPRFVVWGMIILLSPITFLYNAYDNYSDSFGGRESETYPVTTSTPMPSASSTNKEDVRVEPPGPAKKVDEVPATEPMVSADESPGPEKNIDEVPITEPVVTTDAHAEQPITEQQADILRSIIEIIDSSLIQGEYTPDIRNYIRAKGKEFGITEEASDALLLEKLVEKGFSPEEEGTFDILSVRCYTAAKKPKDKKTPLPEPEIKPEEPQAAQAQVPSKISDQEKPRVHQEVQDDTLGPIVAANLERDKFDEKKKTKRNPTILIAAAVGIILVIVGFFYYNNNNKVKMEQLQEELTQKEARLREEAKRAEDAARKAEIERQKTEAERQKAEIAQAEAAREIAEKEAAAREAATRVSAMQEADRLSSVKSLQDGRRYFEMGKYELCVEKMKEVLRRDRNNREAERYVKMAQQRLNEAKRQFQNLKFGGQE